MKRVVLVALLVVGVWCGGGQESHAGFEMGLTVGGNYSLLVNNPKASERVGLNAELMLSYRLAIVSFDMGTVYDFLKKHVELRPGMRLHLGWFYLRLALPMTFAHNLPSDDMFNLGVLAGAGISIKVKKFLFLLEGNISPFFIKLNERGLLLPAEVRLGVGYRF